MSEGTYSYSNRHRMHEPQVTNYNEVANCDHIKPQPPVTDTERLDFLLKHSYAIQINDGYILSSREKIDEEMNRQTQREKIDEAMNQQPMYGANQGGSSCHLRAT